MFETLIDTDMMERFIEAWNKALEVIRNFGRDLSEILADLCKAIAKAQKDRDASPARQRKCKARCVWYTAILFVPNHAAAMRFHVAATGD